MNAANGFIISLNYEIYDRLLGTTGTDWSADTLEIFAGFKEQGKEATQEILDGRVAGTSPSHALDAYTGDYDHDMYAGVVVENRDGVLVVNFADTFEATLEHWHFDTFRATWNQPDTGDQPPNLVSFDFGADGLVSVIHLDIEGEVPFKKRVEAQEE